MLARMRSWLQTYPDWEGSLQLDYLEESPGCAGLYPRGIKELSNQEDVLGNKKVRYRCQFLLRRASISSEENAQWLMDFQQWVAWQTATGQTPKFGDEPKTEWIQAFEGRLDSHKPAGNALYTVQLAVDFTKIFRGE